MIAIRPRIGCMACFILDSARKQARKTVQKNTKEKVMAFCTHCGRELAGGKFCPGCGAAVSTQVAEVQATTALEENAQAVIAEQSVQTAVAENEKENIQKKNKIKIASSAIMLVGSLLFFFLPFLRTGIYSISIFDLVYKIVKGLIEGTIKLSIYNWDMILIGLILLTWLTTMLTNIKRLKGDYDNLKKVAEPSVAGKKAMSSLISVVGDVLILAWVLNYEFIIANIVIIGIVMLVAVIMEKVALKK